MTREPSFALTTLRMFSGVILWAAHFVGIYAFTALACTRGFDSAVPGVIVIATGVAVLVALLIARTAWRRENFADWMTVSVAAIAVLAMCYEMFALLWVPVCGGR